MKSICKSRCATYARQMAQKQLTGEGQNMGVKEQSEPISNETARVEKGDLQLDMLTSKKEKHELSLLVKSIKMKSKQVPHQGKNPKQSEQK
jgi:hypothetical protein